MRQRCDYSYWMPIAAAMMTGPAPLVVEKGQMIWIYDLSPGGLSNLVLYA